MKTKLALPSIGALIVSTLFAAAQFASGDELHSPAVGSPERKGILDALHAEYTTGSGSSAKFQVKHFKVHNGWAWINVVPLDKSGQPEGDEWPSLLRQKDGAWQIIDLIAVAAAIDDPVGPAEPSAKFIRALQKKYPSVPRDIIPGAGGSAGNDSGEQPALQRFLISTKGTYGWNPVKGTISYDFFPDGRLHIQGPDGEATMWEGKWKLSGDQLTLINTTQKTTKTVAASIEGSDLLLDGKRYQRYRPQ